MVEPLSPEELADEALRRLEARREKAKAQPRVPTGQWTLKPRPGVNLDLDPGARPHFDRLQSVVSALGRTGTITSARRPSATPSHHPHGRAIDFVSPGDMSGLAAELLRQGFRAQYERKGQRNPSGSVATGDHIHVTLAPPRRPLVLGSRGGTLSPEERADQALKRYQQQVKPPQPTGTLSPEERADQVLAELRGAVERRVSTGSPLPPVAVPGVGIPPPPPVRQRPTSTPPSGIADLRMRDEALLARPPLPGELYRPSDEEERATLARINRREANRPLRRAFNEQVLGSLPVVGGALREAARQNPEGASRVVSGGIEEGVGLVLPSVRAALNNDKAGPAAFEKALTLDFSVMRSANLVAKIGEARFALTPKGRAWLETLAGAEKNGQKLKAAVYRVLNPGKVAGRAIGGEAAFQVQERAQGRKPIPGQGAVSGLLADTALDVIPAPRVKGQPKKPPTPAVTVPGPGEVEGPRSQQRPRVAPLPPKKKPLTPVTGQQQVPMGPVQAKQRPAPLPPKSEPTPAPPKAETPQGPQKPAPRKIANAIDPKTISKPFGLPDDYYVNTGKQEEGAIVGGGNRINPDYQSPQQRKLEERLERAVQIQDQEGARRLRKQLDQVQLADENALRAKLAPSQTTTPPEATPAGPAGPSAAAKPPAAPETPPKAPPLGPKTREPWQMTREEFTRQQQVPEDIQALARLPERGGLQELERIARRIGVRQGDIVGNPFTLAKSIEERVKFMGTIFDPRHANAVTEAIESGRPVPPEVLKDYPKLAAKAPVTGSGQAPAVADIIEPTRAPSGESRLVPESQVNAPAAAPTKPGAVSVSAPVPPAKPPAKAPPLGPKAPRTTGLANQVQEEEAIAGLIRDPAKLEGKGAAQWQLIGQERLKAESDPIGFAETRAREIAEGRRGLDAESIGVALEGKRRLLQAVNGAREALDKAIKGGGDVPAAQKAYEDAQGRLQTFLADVQQGKGQWSDVGRALQAGTEVDTGNYAEVLSEARRVKGGAPVDEKTAAAFKADTEKIKVLEQDLAKAEAENKRLLAETVTAREAKAAQRTRKRTDLRKEREDIFAEIKAAAGKAAGKVGADPTGAMAAYELLKATRPAGRLAINLAKETALTLEEVTEKVVQEFARRGVRVTKEQVIDDIAALSTGKPQTRTELQQAVSRLKSQAKGDARVRQQIAEYQRQLREGDYVEPTPRSRQASQRLLDLRAERDSLRAQVLARIADQKRTRFQRAVGTAVDVVSAPRSLMTSADISAPFRQGLLLLGRPKQSIPAFARQLQAFGSESAFNRIAAQIKASPNASLQKRSGLYIADRDNVSLTAREEQYMSRLVSKVPWVKASERAYLTYLNSLRSDTFDAVAASLQRKGITPENNPKAYKDLAAWVNIATGRGVLGPKAAGAAPLANAVLFGGLRYHASRVQALNPATYVNLEPSVRLEALRDLAVTVGAGTALLGVAAGAGAKVETDPRSSDFAKIRFGNTRVDPWGGFQQWVRLFAQVGSGQAKVEPSAQEKFRGVTEKMRTVGPVDTVARFARTKLGPGPSLLVDARTGKTVTGEPFDWRWAAVERVFPMWTGDLLKLSKEHGPVGAGAATLLSMIGFGVQNYEPREKGGQKKGEFPPAKY